MEELGLPSKLSVTALNTLGVFHFHFVYPNPMQFQALTWKLESVPI